MSFTKAIKSSGSSLIIYFYRAQLQMDEVNQSKSLMKCIPCHVIGVFSCHLWLHLNPEYNISTRYWPLFLGNKCLFTIKKLSCVHSKKIDAS